MLFVAVTFCLDRIATCHSMLPQRNLVLRCHRIRRVSSRWLSREGSFADRVLGWVKPCPFCLWFIVADWGVHLPARRSLISSPSVLGTDWFTVRGYHLLHYIMHYYFWLSNPLLFDIKQEAVVIEGWFKWGSTGIHIWYTSRYYTKTFVVCQSKSWEMFRCGDIHDPPMEYVGFPLVFTFSQKSVSPWIARSILIIQESCETTI